MYRMHTICNALFSGTFLAEDEFPSLLFMIDGEEYRLGENSTPTLVLGGAYSVDKWYRLEQQYLGHKGYRWFYDEQLSEKEREAIDAKIPSMSPQVILSHTCPLSHTPRDLFLPMVDQRTVDRSTELWLETIKHKLPDAKWYCGHWHTDRLDGNVRFMYNDFIEFK